ncbi:geranylgeranyl pyrophosphate synthase [Delitschia confertaspora ATCC 74209]|uniref:geranylgeranyl diphosphate synthase n=1 Tax=Delitschia confertaspora ATCC 74209 TaxID=1513339 RepID=A0A9P4JTL8_9PLEO|nr:geranylgeranyl pyrophosphate synthase [Delitschia confertaspora ATCC 74209]
MGIADGLTSHLVDLSQYDTHGLCANYTLRRHKFEKEANAGCHEARSDWIKYIGPIKGFGNCNPINGNFTAVVLPLCKPERIRLLAYVLEYAFLYDNIVEASNPELELEKGREKHMNPLLGKKNIQAKIMLLLSQTDKECTKRVMQVWEEMLSTTLKDKNKAFRSLKEYVDFRIVDTGAPFVEAMMLWGMGMQLTKEEDEILAPIIHPCYAALGLANDYFSFNREWDEFQNSDETALTNAVWLHMKWQNVGVNTAKEIVRNATVEYEREFLQNCAEFRRRHAPIPERLDCYLRALSYQVSGNVVWSLNCPRYHPEFRYDTNAGIEDTVTAQILSIQKPLATSTSPTGIPNTAIYNDVHSRRPSSTESIVSTSKCAGASVGDNTSLIYSATSHSLTSGRKHSIASVKSARDEKLGVKVVQAPFEYISSLPSKGVRDTLVDALNIWLNIAEERVGHIKRIVGKFHSASLMLDDIEDGSELRRGKPVAHAVFGVAQTINSANYAIIEAANDTRISLGSDVVEVVLNELLELHIGQSYDLYWTRHGSCPSEDEYLEMVAKKTGGLIRLLARLMFTKETNTRTKTDVEQLAALIGLHFQIRDDYQNLKSAEYSSQKGFCEDLDEGKFSFPLIHCLSSNPDNQQLREILQRRRDQGYLSREHKFLVLEDLEWSGSLEYSLETLKRLQVQIENDIDKLDAETGRESWVMKALVQKLSV